MWHWNMPLQYVDYFKLNTVKSQQTQEELFTSPVTAYKNLDRVPTPEDS